MEPLSVYFILIPIAVFVACLGFVAYAIRARIRRSEPPSAVGQVLMLGAALFLFAYLGAMLIAPTGPGCASPLYLTLLVPYLLFLILGPGLSRIMAGVVVCACLIGLVSEHRAREHFGARMRARMEERRRQALEKQKEDTEQSAAPLPRDPQPGHSEGDR